MIIKDKIYIAFNILNRGDRLKIPKKAFEKIFNRNPSFVSNVEMAAYVDEWVKKFDLRYDLIVGVPRSGLMVASLIATKLAKPLSTSDNIIWTSKSIITKPIRKILVVDDCITTGKSINTTADKIKELYPGAIVHKGALFANEDNKWMLDTYCAILNGNQLFQWNLMHYKIGVVGFDMDGVLCEECTDDDDEVKYLRFLSTARPYLIPEYEIDYIITSRLEKYRPQTETWLKDHEVKYKNLIMWDVPNKKDRDGAATYKSKIIKCSPIQFFIESDREQAEEIWRRTKIICLCTDEMKMFD